MNRQSSPPPGLELPEGYKWSWWWDTRRGCALLLCAFGTAALVLFAVTAVTGGWVEGVFGLLGAAAVFMAANALLGFLWPTKKGQYWVL